MPHGYHHLAYDQRCQIYALKKSGLSQTEIAQSILADQPTISRELNRNKGQKGYRHKQAHTKATKRRYQASATPRKMTDAIIPILEQMISEDQFSPEQVSGRLKITHGVSISHEWIYLHIWNDKRNGGTLYSNLRRCGKKYNKRGGKTAGRGLIPNRVGIENRPPEVANKLRVGDFEGDTIIGADHRGAILSLVERKTKVTKLHLLSGTKAEETALAMIKKLEPLKDLVFSVTTDNGKEFAQHEKVSEMLDTKFYFAQPYHSWERGLNENTNGLVRQYFPKGCDFTKLTQEQVLEVENKLNNRPRKTLGYRTPNEEFLLLTGILPLCYALQS